MVTLIRMELELNHQIFGKIMKKLLIIIPFLLLVFISCGKNKKPKDSKESSTIILESSSEIESSVQDESTNTKSETSYYESNENSNTETEYSSNNIQNEGEYSGNPNQNWSNLA